MLIIKETQLEVYETLCFLFNFSYKPKAALKIKSIDFKNVFLKLRDNIYTFKLKKTKFAANTRLIRNTKERPF